MLAFKILLGSIGFYAVLLFLAYLGGKVRERSSRLRTLVDGFDDPMIVLLGLDFIVAAFALCALGLNAIEYVINQM